MKVPISEPLRKSAVGVFGLELEKRIKRHGEQSFLNRHEGLGTITEEYHELVEAVHRGGSKEIGDEAMDLAIAAFWLALTAKVTEV